MPHSGLIVLVRLALSCWAMQAEAGSARDVEAAYVEPAGGVAGTPESLVQPVAAQIPVDGTGASQAGNGSPQAVPYGANDAGVSDAERIARLQRSIAATQSELAALNSELSAPEGDYQKAEAEFCQMDATLAAKSKALADLDASGPGNPAGGEEETARLRAEVEDLKTKWSLSKDRFNLEIADRKALKAKIGALERRLAEDRSALDVLFGGSAVSADAAAPAEPAAAAPVEGAAASEAARLPAAPQTPPAFQALAPPALLPGLADPPAAAPAPAAGPPDPPSKELAAATAEARRKTHAADQAEQAARSITARAQSLVAQIELERTLRDTAHKKVDNADDTLRNLDEEFKRRMSDGESMENLKQARERIAEANSRLSELRRESRRRTTQLDHLQSELAKLQADEIRALREAESRRREADAANERVARLADPLAPGNVLAWLLNHGLKIVVIVLAVGGFVWLSRVFENRLVELMARRGVRGSLEERENRAKTLVGVFHNAASVVTVGGGVLMVMDEIGMPVGPLMGGAAVVGLAVAFGAQSLIKDYFYGFMILLEQQYLVNDVIRIGDTAGQVERISMRMTVLRDLEGRVHFISHGQIASVTNLTHGWSRAVFDVGVSYKEDVNRVMQVLMELGMQLRNDAEYRSMILEDPTMLGVDAFGDSAVRIKFFIKTRPLKQWLVKRELLRRIKSTFDEQGIEIPVPHRVLYHRGGSAEAIEVDESAARRAA